MSKIVVCKGDKYCDVCGDCIYCFGDLDCIDGGAHQIPEEEIENE